MTAEMLSAIVATVLAVLFAYVPKFASWYKPLQEETKRLIMLGLLIAASGAIYGLSCAEIWMFVTCDRAGLIGLVEILITAIVTNQGVYRILPKVGLNKAT